MATNGLVQVALHPLNVFRHGALFALVILVPPVSPAQTTTAITADGTLGTQVPAGCTVCDITGGTRPNNGSNLFHGFEQFDVGNGGMANFINDSGLPTTNILSRVTGNSASDISGTVKTTGFQGANLFLINPAGIVFGPGATLAVEGTFHATTADYIKFTDGSEFRAAAAPASSLTTAPVQSFGFLGTSAPVIASGLSGAIRISGLSISNGQPATFVARDARAGSVDVKAIAIDGIFSTGGGEVTIAGIDAPGEAVLGTSPSGARTNVNVTAFGKLGEIGLSGGANLVAATSNVDAGRVVMSAAEVSLDELAQVTTSTNGIGRAGDIEINAGNLAVREGSKISSNTSSNSSAGKGGSIKVTATESIHIAGNGINPLTMTAERSTISSSTSRRADAGQIVLSAPVTQIEDSGVVQATTSGNIPNAGAGGAVTISAGRLVLRNGGEITAATRGTGAGGGIIIRSDDLSMSEGARVSATTERGGEGGSIDIAAGGTAKLAGSGTSVTTDAIRTSTNSGVTGDAGAVVIKAGRLIMSDNAGISANTATTGKGGDVDVQASEIETTDGASISARSTATGLNDPDKGRSGNVSVTAGNTLRLRNGGEISVETDEANAGDIHVKAGTLVHLRNKSKISTSARGGEGNGGNITIDPIFVVLDTGSEIVARAKKGRGGNINIVTDFFFAPQDTCPNLSCVSASSELGIDGTVNISATDADVISGTLLLPESFLDPSGVLSERCAARAMEKISSFVVTGREGMPRSPDALLAAAAPMPAASGAKGSAWTGAPSAHKTSAGANAEAVALTCGPY